MVMFFLDQWGSPAVEEALSEGLREKGKKVGDEITLRHGHSRYELE